MSTSWLLYVLNLPSGASTARMRIWRGLKGLGAGLMRDGVYVLPQREGFAEALDAHVRSAVSADGQAYVLSFEADPPLCAQLRALFDRTPSYERWQQQLAKVRPTLANSNEGDARRAELGLRRALEAITSVDFFPGASLDEARAALADLGNSINQQFSPGEPSANARGVPRCDMAEHQGRCWTTRANLWVDRVASAWLINAYIDPGARFLWHDDPVAAPADAIGFDFDGAAFSHVGDYVTFQVLARAFALERRPGLERLGELVRYLDIGGDPVPEAAGFVALLGSLRERARDDDDFLALASPLFADLARAYDKADNT